MLEQPTRHDNVYRTPKVRRQAQTLVVTEALELETTAAPGFHDITDDVNAIVAESGVTFGQVTVFSCHTTAAIRINENEPLLLRDMARTLRQIAPSERLLRAQRLRPPHRQHERGRVRQRPRPLPAPLPLAPARRSR